jgi:type I restriction enzyme M protein
MFVQSEKFIAAHGGRLGDISVYGQEFNYTTWRLAKMNLAIRGIDGQIAHGDSFHNDRHPDLKADFILANPPLNISDWGGERLRDDKALDLRRAHRRATPTSPGSSHGPHLSPTGRRGLRPRQRLHVLQPVRRGATSAETSSRPTLVDCMVAPPGQLFYSTQIPVCSGSSPAQNRDLSQALRSGDATVPALRTATGAAGALPGRPASSGPWRTARTGN